MNSYAVSIHIDRPTRIRLPIEENWTSVLQEVTDRTAATFGTAILGLHEDYKSRFMFFAALAHRRDAQGRFMSPANPEDCLYDPNGNPLPDAMHRWVAGTLINSEGRRADDHAFFAVDRGSLSAVKDWVQEIEGKPPQYHTVHRNCVKFALDALAVAGLNLSTDNLSRSSARLRRPEDVSRAIALDTVNTGMQRAVKPILLNRANIDVLCS